MRVCSVNGCPNLYPTNQGSRCSEHRAAADQRRGTAAQRGYTGRGHQTFRNAVLNRDPICVLCGIAQSTVADHYPRSRKELTDLHMDPNDPDNGRGLCKTCHDRETATHQPGGWNNR